MVLVEKPFVLLDITNGYVIKPFVMCIITNGLNLEPFVMVSNTNGFSTKTVCDDFLQNGKRCSPQWVGGFEPEN